MNKTKVLFLCTGNSARSQMAEAFLRRYGGDGYEVFSAGLEPQGVNPLTVAVMDEVGMDIREQTSKDVKKYLGKETFHYAVFVCAKAERNCPSIYPFALEKLSWPFEDPASVEGTEGERLKKFREVRDRIEAGILDWLAERRAVEE